jgi:predicted flap endonuclease-1-like 5' DNA nuclease
VTPQDLKVVEGIGPKIEEVLQAHGIVNYAHLAKVAPSKIRLLLDAAGPQFQVANPETWPEQAALLRDGKLQELKEYQNFLVGGTTPGK